MKILETELERFYEWLFQNALSSKTAWTMTYGRQHNQTKKHEWIQKRIKAFRTKKGIRDNPINAHDLERINKKLIEIYRVSLNLETFELKNAFKRWGGTFTLEVYKQNNPYLKLAKMPTVSLAPSTSKGHYNAKRHHITIDPYKSKTNPQKMATLKFELDNALSREKRLALLESKKSVKDMALESIRLEVETSKREVDRIVARNKARSLENLIKNKVEERTKKPWIDKVKLGKYTSYRHHLTFLEYLKLQREQGVQFSFISGVGLV
jgi:hypothetical protein